MYCLMLNLVCIILAIFMTKNHVDKGWHWNWSTGGRFVWYKENGWYEESDKFTLAVTGTNDDS
jgi:hypothetical protein